MPTINITPGNPADTINAAIKNADAGSTVRFAPGTYVFSDPIIVQRDDIRIVGAGANATTLKFRYDVDGDGAVTGDEGGHGIEIRGFPERLSRIKKADRTELRAGVAAGDSILPVVTTDKIDVGDALFISQINTADYLDAIGGCVVGTPCRITALNRTFRETISTVVDVDHGAGVVTLAHPVPFSMSPTEAPVNVQELVDIRQDVVVSDLAIEFEIFDPLTGAAVTPDHNLFVNQQPGFLADSGPHSSAVLIEGGLNISLRNITVKNAPSQAFTVRHALNVDAVNLRIDGSFNKGAGGNGYGVDFYEAYHADFQDLEIFNMRHSVLFASWHTETDNTIHVRKTNRDINFHGGPDMNNAVTVDRAVLEYGVSPQMWPIVSLGGRVVHQQTDIQGLGNSVHFDVGAGAGRDDIIYAGDHGATLTGDQGDDILVAGSGPDVLDGGGGVDVASYAMATERIFVDLRGNQPATGGAEGDVLINIERIIGSDFRDLILADDFDNLIAGGAERDIIYARNGDDVVMGDGGPDALHGQRGDDVLTGGDGADQFYLDDHAGLDQITDFEPGVDLVNFSRINIVDGLEDLIIESVDGAGTRIRFHDDTGSEHAVVLQNVDDATLIAHDFAIF